MSFSLGGSRTTMSNSFKTWFAQSVSCKQTRCGNRIWSLLILPNAGNRTHKNLRNEPILPWSVRTSVVIETYWILFSSPDSATRHNMPVHHPLAGCLLPLKSTSQINVDFQRGPRCHNVELYRNWAGWSCRPNTFRRLAGTSRRTFCRRTA